MESLAALRAGFRINCAGLLLCLCIPLAGENLPIGFEPNQGQANASVKFLARVPGYTLYVTSEEAVFAARDGSVERMKWSGANPNMRMEGIDKLPGLSNYFIGNDPKQWRTNIPNYARFALRGVYPGIDLIFYGTDKRLEYDWVVMPGADPEQIRVRWESPQEISRTSSGDLILSASLRQRKPRILQGGQTVDGGYTVRGKEVRFEIGHYDRGQPLVIDPVLVYSTFLGGSMGDSNVPKEGDWGTGVAVDSAGNVYLTGHTASLDFPTVKPIQPSYGGRVDAFVTKINAAGSAILYSTYVGGVGYDNAYAIALDSAGDVYIAGGTTSLNFPTVNAFQPNYHGAGGGNADPSTGQLESGNVFVTKLNPAGSQLLYSTYLGGSGVDFGYGLAVDSAGNAYVTGSSSSADFPTFNPIQPKLRSKSGNAFLFKFNPSGSALLYSTFLGGSGTDGGIWVAVDGQGNAYLTGFTNSRDFPTVNPIQPNLATTSPTGFNTFVTKVNAAGSAMVYSTFLGGSGDDEAQGITVDSSGNAYVTGYATSRDFPTVNAFQNKYASASENGNAFVTKINAAGSAWVYSTYLGGSGADNGNSIAVDSAGNAYVAGYTSSANFPISKAIQSNYAGKGDGFVTALNPSGSGLVYSTYLGGSGEDFAFGIALDSATNVYVTGQTYSGDFPILHALQGTDRRTDGNGTAFLMKIAASSQGTGVPTSLVITGGNNQSATTGSRLPQPLGVLVTGSSGAGIAGATVNFTVTSGSATLSVSSVQTDTSGAAGVTVTLGAAAGPVTVSAAIAGSTLAPVNFTETATANPSCPIGPPQISSVNSATDFGGFSNFASGSYLEVKGSNLAIDARQWAAGDFQGSNAPTNLDGSKVLIDNLPGYVSYISDKQINVQAPADSATGSVPIVVTNCAGTSNTVMLQKNAVAPGLLAPASFNVGKQYLVALFASDLAQGVVTYVGKPGLIAGANFRAAKPNDVIVVYGLAFGSVTPATPPGVIASGATDLPGLSISFDSTPAVLNYKGLYPGFVGLYEFYVTVPNVATGDSQINVSINGTPVPQTAFLTVQGP